MTRILCLMAMSMTLAPGTLRASKDKLQSEKGPPKNITKVRTIVGMENLPPDVAKLLNQFTKERKADLTHRFTKQELQTHEQNFGEPKAKGNLSMGFIIGKGRRRLTAKQSL